MNEFDTLVLLIFWRRYDTALRVVQRIKALRPTRMFLACDGPRSGNREDSHRINEARSKIEAAIKEKIDNLAHHPDPLSIAEKTDRIE